MRQNDDRNERRGIRRHLIACDLIVREIELWAEDLTLTALPHTHTHTLSSIWKIINAIQSVHEVLEYNIRT